MLSELFQIDLSRMASRHFLPREPRHRSASRAPRSTASAASQAALAWSANGPGAARSTATSSLTGCSYLLMLLALSPAMTTTAVPSVTVLADATRSVGRQTQGGACSTRPVPVANASCCASAAMPPLVGRGQARRQGQCSAVMAPCRTALVRSPCSPCTAAPSRSGTTCRTCSQPRALTSRLSGPRVVPSGASSCVR